MKMTPRTKSVPSVLTLAVTAALLAAPQMQAASATWSASSTDAQWTNSLNWGVAIPNATNQSATFSTAISGGFGGTANPILLGASTITLQNIVFGAGAGAYQIGGTGSTTLLALRSTGAGTTPSFGDSISLAAGVTSAQIIAAPITFSAPSSTEGGYAFINNSTTSSASLSFTGTVLLSTASNRTNTLLLDGSNTGSNTISGVISTTGSQQGAHALIQKNGAGTWILSGSNSFLNNGASNQLTTGIQVNGGTLSAQNNNALGTNATANTLKTNVNSGGTLQLANSITLDNGVLVTLNDGATLQSSGSTTTNAGVSVATAATSVTLSTVGSGDVFTIGNGTNDFTGGTAGTTVTTISGPGTILLATSSNYAGSFSIASGSLRLGSPTALGAATTATVAFSSGSTGKLQLFGNSATVVSLNTNATVGTPKVENGAAGTATLTVNNTAANTFAGVLQNGTTGTLALTKTGTGTLTLSGASTYSGATAISGGALNVTNSSGSATGTSAVALNTATLTGAGSISGTVTTTAASTITPGTVTAGNAGSGVLTLGGLTLVGGTTFNFGLNASNALANYVNAGALTLPGSGTVTLNLYTPGTATPFAAAGTYDLFQYSSLAGGSVASAFSFGTSIAGYNSSFTSNGTYVQLTLTAAGVLGSWTNGAANGNWSDAGNWSGGVPSAAGDAATFASAPGVVNLDANETVGGLTFNNASGYTISGANTLTLNNSGSGVTVTNTAGNSDVQTAVTLADNAAVSVSSGTQLTISGNIGDTGSHTLTKTGSGTLVLSGTNTYAGATSVNAGTLTFNGLGALGSSTALNLGGSVTNGTLRYATGNTADISGLTVTVGSGGATVDTNGNNVTFANAIGNSGTGSFTKTGAGTLTFAGSNTYTGTTTVGGGTLSVSSNANLGTEATGAGLVFTGTGGTLATTASLGLYNGAVGTNDRTITLSGTDGTLAPTTGTTLTANGAITGTGKLIKADAGQVTIRNTTSGLNTFSGGTDINAGTLSLGDANAASTGLGSGTVTFNGGTLNNRYTATLGPTTIGNFANNLVVNTGQTGTFVMYGNQTLSGSLTGAGTLNLQVDYVRDNLTGNWSGFTGQINLLSNAQGGDFRLNSGNSFGTAKLNLGAGTNIGVLFNFGAGGQTNNVGEVTGSGFLGGGTVGGRVLTWSVGGANTNATFDGVIRDGGVTGSGTGNTAITKVGTGTWTLTGINTYTSATNVNLGTLQIGNGTTTGTAIVNSSGITVGASGALAVNLATGETFANSVTNNGAVNTIAAGANTLSGSISGSGSLNHSGSGTTTLSGSNSYSGATTVANGTLAVTGSLTGTSSISVTTGGTLLLSGTETLRDAAGLTLNTGTVKFTDATSNAIETLGSLTLAGASTIDFGTGSGNQLLFSGAITGLSSFTLTVKNWTVGQDVIGYNTSLTQSELNNISFYDDTNTLLGTGTEIGFVATTFQAVAVPEPTTVVGGSLMAGLAAWSQRRNLRKLARGLKAS